MITKQGLVELALRSVTYRVKLAAASNHEDFPIVRHEHLERAFLYAEELVGYIEDWIAHPDVHQPECDDFVASAGTPGPWITTSGTLYREAVVAAGNEIARSEHGATAVRVAKAMGLEWGKGNKTSRALTLLKRWDLIEYRSPLWVWIGGIPEERP